MPGWLEEHLPGVEQVPVSSNAEGARRARDEKGTAAIAGETAAEVYGLKVLAAEIEDRADNTTRFLVLGRKLFAPSGEDRTTLLVSVGRHRCAGRALPVAGAAGTSPGKPDAHRVASVAATQVGLRVLHRPRGARRGTARRARTRSAQKARLALSGARLVSASGAVSAAPARRWRVAPGGTVTGDVTVPGDKSISHRALMLGALAHGRDAHPRLPRGRGLPRDRCARCGARRSDRAPERHGRCACTAGVRRACGACSAARHGQCRHGDAPLHGAARAAAVRLDADRR